MLMQLVSCFVTKNTVLSYFFIFLKKSFRYICKSITKNLSFENQEQNLDRNR